MKGAMGLLRHLYYLPDKAVQLIQYISCLFGCYMLFIVFKPDLQQFLVLIRHNTDYIITFFDSIPDVYLRKLPVGFGCRIIFKNQEAIEEPLCIFLDFGEVSEAMRIDLCDALLYMLQLFSYGSIPAPVDNERQGIDKEAHT